MELFVPTTAPRKCAPASGARGSVWNFLSPPPLLGNEHPLAVPEALIETFCPHHPLAVPKPGPPSQPQSGLGKRAPCRKQWTRYSWCHARRAPESLWNVIARHTSFSTSRRCNSYLAFKGKASGSSFAELLTHFNSGATARPGCPQHLARHENFHLAKIELRFHGFLEGA